MVENNIKTIINCTNDIKDIFNDLQYKYKKCAYERQAALKFIRTIAEEICNKKNITLDEYLKLSKGFLEDFNGFDKEDKD